MSDINWGLIRSGSTFQDLICCLIRLEDHEARLYVRPGKDYAQDARSGDGLTVYQMKFHQNESNASAIADAKKEAKKIAEYLDTPGISKEIWQGVKKWVLISNIAFNPNDELKWIKEVKPLFACLGLEASYWQKSEIETRLLKYPDLKQAYFGGETRVFLGIAEAQEQMQQLQGFHHPHALNAHYQGRESELEKYRNFITNATKKILVIHGPGGIGKTRFLLEGAKTQALMQGWHILWANVATMTTTSSWFMGIIPERPTLLLIDEPDDAKFLKTLVEQIFGGRTSAWKVAIAVRSPNDIVLKSLQEAKIRHFVEELPLVPLEESAAFAFCKELLELGSLQAEASNWKEQAATWIAKHYDYPIWMAIAIKLLENKGNLETMPQEVEGLASEYLGEIIKQQQIFHSDKILNLLHWIALFNTVNREDAEVIDWIRAKVAFKNTTELQRYLDSLISRNVIFERGARNRLLKIKPDVLADYILQDWLIYKTRYGHNEPSSEALEIVTEVSEILKNSAEVSNIQKLLLRSLAKFELNQQLYKNHVNILGTLLANWREQVPTMNARQKLKYLNLLSEISFAYVSDVLPLLREILISNSESEIISTIFGQRIISHDDVILALPRIVYDTALYAQTDSAPMTIISLLCDLVIKERDIATRRQQGLPNDGNRAEIILPRIIKGQLEFRGSFETSALNKANDLLENIHFQGNINQNQEMLLNTLVKPLLSIEQERTSFDGRSIIITSWKITVDQPEWKLRNLLRTKIREILREKILQPAQAVILWNLLAYAHGEINRAISYSEDHTTISDDLLLEAEFTNSHNSDIQKSSVSYANVSSEEFRNVLIQDLQWLVDLLNSQNHNLDIQELTAARDIWDWHYKFDKDPELKKLATQCEIFFKNHEFFPQYAPLLSWESYEVLEQWASETTNKLITSNNTQSIYDFVDNGVKFLGSSEQISRLFIVAYRLGIEVPQSQSVCKFVEEALQLSIESSEFQFAIRVCQGWIRITRQNNLPGTTKVIEQLLQWVKSSEKIVQLIQVMYGETRLIITEPEVNILLAQKEHFLQTDSATSFLGLLGSIFFSSLEQIKNAVEATLNQIDHKQLASALSTFLQSLDYGMRSHINNLEQTIKDSLKNWILEQVLRLPDIDDLGGTSIHYVQDVLKMLGKPDLEWLVNAIDKRIQMFSESSNIRILPSRERLSQWITPVSLEQTADIAIQNLITKLLSYNDSSPILLYALPQYLVDIDPNGIITPDLVVNKFRNHKIRENPHTIYQWSKFAGYYRHNSPAWRKIAHEACSLAIQFDERNKYSIFHALKNPETQVWISNIGEVPARFEIAVETAKQNLESETDSALIPFWKWMLQSVEAELMGEIERVKEEIEE